MLWVIVKVAHKTSELVSNAIVEGLQPFADRVKTLTYDNVKEFELHIQIDQAIKSTGYFARPFASWGRGYKENFNDLLRQYVPKKRSINTVVEEEITMMADSKQI
jgi:IS30 family transposase